MKLPAIRKLAERYRAEELRAAEAQLMEGLPLTLEVEGEDEGEQLTHILSALQVLQMVAEQGLSLQDALRQMAQRVRGSIG